MTTRTRETRATFNAIPLFGVLLALVLLACSSGVMALLSASSFPSPRLGFVAALEATNQAGSDAVVAVPAPTSGASEAAAKPREQQRSSFVGRELALRRLEASLSQALEGPLQAVFMAAEAGAGLQGGSEPRSGPSSSPSDALTRSAYQSFALRSRLPSEAENRLLHLSTKG